MGFENFGLDKRLVSGLRSAGYTRPTPVQEKVVPAVLAGRDVLAAARTGTGKTAAFVLPVLQRLLDADAGKRGPVRVLVLAPTRELALQIHETFFTLGRQTGIRCAAVYGGAGISPQARDVKKSAIVTACPGRLLDLMARDEIDLSAVDILVLDEADRMLDMGFRDEVRRILDQLPEERMTLLFSATLPDGVAELAGLVLADPEFIRVDAAPVAEGVEHMCCPVPLHLKQRLLKFLLRELDFESVLVFVRTKRWARRLAQRLSKWGFRAADLHGDLSQSKRNRALDGFKSGEFNILVATDLAARGIDCSGISHVINYDMPDSVEIYIHRIGRTGRAGRSGSACLLCAPEERERLVEIEESLGYSLPLYNIDSFNYDAPPSIEPESETKFCFNKK
ncbi:DEAD/DEAH box helicase [Maridesulfovibrio sp.]|uniref:DEAD/DEAH box helicase n=1 Tax=Maridesulfovibrio sp. TaxID=2795000 RepID=UPI002A18B9E7|nr:DEAD/DEAH box helicase [Maridesulfovibrio sp.]